MSLTAFPNGITSFGMPVSPGFGMSTGNVYYICQTTNTVPYADMVLKFGGQTYENDGSSILHTTIQSGLDACVADRDDYVLINLDSSDYDITAALTMSLKGVHLICPAGLGANGMGMNAARVNIASALASITLTADCVEMAGIFFKSFLNSTHIINLSGSRWHANIHDNFIGGAWSSAGSACIGIGNATGPMQQCSIHHNYITNYSPSAMTGTDNAVSAFITLGPESSTRNLIADNILQTGANTTVATGIKAIGHGDMVLRNYLFETYALNAVQTGIFTLGISAGVAVFCSDNKFGMATPANALSGGTADQSYCDNWEATSGATVVT